MLYEVITFCSDLRTSHRRIDAMDVQIPRLDRNLTGDARRDRCVIDEDAAFAQCLEHAVGAKHDVGKVIVVADASDDDVRPFRGVGGVFSYPAGKA